MKLLIVRHGDPDYSIDSLTPKGWREAELLKDRLTKLDVAAFYCSPLGRAKDTSKATLNALGRTAEIFDWLREFDGYVIDPESGEHTYSWDRTPAFLSENDDYYDKDKWISTPFTAAGMCPKIQNRLRRHRRAACTPRLYPRRQDIQSRAGEQRHRGALLPFRRGVRSALAYFKDIARCALA